MLWSLYQKLLALSIENEKKKIYFLYIEVLFSLSKEICFRFEKNKEKGEKNNFSQEIFG